MDIIKKFLQAEINSKEYYDTIISFINSYEIRKGEFEGNEYIIMKLDRDNFIVFPEYDDGEDGVQIPFCQSIYKNELIKEIETYAKLKGINWDVFRYKFVAKSGNVLLWIYSMSGIDTFEIKYLCYFLI